MSLHGGRLHLGRLVSSFALGVFVLEAGSGLNSRLFAQGVSPPGGSYRVPQAGGDGLGIDVTAAYPRGDYYEAFTPYYDGQFNEALAAFAAAARHGRKVPGAWLDSICCHAMAAECCLHLGRLPQALEHYDAALTILLTYPRWMERLQLAAQLAPAGPSQYRPTPWGQAGRAITLGYFPSQVLFFEGQLDNNGPYTQGGVVEPPRLIQLNVCEIVRTTALALRRRRELLGPLSAVDPLTKRVLETLHNSSAPNWSETFLEIELALAYRAAGKDPQAQTLLERSLVTDGTYDHPLTGVVLLELARMALDRGDLRAARQYFDEASFAAAQFLDADTVEEALRGRSLTNQLAGDSGLDPAPQLALAWSRRGDYRPLTAALLLLSAENFAALGHADEAAAAVAIADSTVGRHELRQSSYGARLNWLWAVVKCQQGDAAGATTAIGGALALEQRCSRWIFQTNLADRLASTAAVTPRAAVTLYAELLRDPNEHDWVRDPLEALCVLATPERAVFEHWFLAAWERQRGEDLSTLLEIADRARRRTFYNSLPVGGRMLAVRWLLESPVEMLAQRPRLERQALLVRYPAYAEFSRQAAALTTALAQGPLASDDPTDRRQQQSRLAELTEASAAEERIVGEMSLRRDATSFVFPPLRSTKGIQQELAAEQGMLAFFAASGRLFGFSVTKENYQVWEIGPVEKVANQVAELLRAMGHTGANRVLSSKQLRDASWRDRARQLLDTLLALTPTNLPAGLELNELIVVPDGVLWYVPFEALQLATGPQTRPLVARVRMRCAPTAGLAVGDRRGRNPVGRTAIVAGRLYPRQELDFAADAAAAIDEALPGTTLLSRPGVKPLATFASVLDRLVVLDEIDGALNGPYGWSPLTLEPNRQGPTLDDWLRLPFQGPDQILLPGFRTLAENSLRTGSGRRGSEDLFLTTLGLMGAGARTVLLSRWRTGGQTSLDLVREFAQELPHAAASDAWQRAIFLAQQTPLDAEREPRVNLEGFETPPYAEHPFFWSGYLLVDTGVSPADDEEAPGDDQDFPAEEPKKIALGSTK